MRGWDESLVDEVRLSGVDVARGVRRRVRRALPEGGVKFTPNPPARLLPSH